MLERIGGATLQVADAIGGAVLSPITWGMLCAPLVVDATSTAQPLNEPLIKIDYQHLSPFQRRVLAYAAHIEGRQGLPDHSLRVMATIESKAGAHNVCNRFGYCGVTQAGRSEWRSLGYSRYSRLNWRASLWFGSDYAKRNGGDTTFEVYGRHQEGKGGFAQTMSLLNGEYGKVNPTQQMALASHLCNNIGKPNQQIYCMKVGRRFAPAPGVSGEDVARVWTLVWSREIRRLTEEMEEAGV